jgi:hypothetical protein
MPLPFHVLTLTTPPPLYPSASFPVTHDEVANGGPGQSKYLTMTLFTNTPHHNRYVSIHTTRGSASQSRQNAKLFLQSSGIGTPPTLHPQASVPPTLWYRWGHTCWREGGGGRVPIPTRGHTVWYSLYLYMYILCAPHGPAPAFCYYQGGLADFPCCLRTLSKTPTSLQTTTKMVKETMAQDLTPFFIFSFHGL